MNTDISNKKYKLGYCMGLLDESCIENYGWLKEQAVLCERFVLGIPDEWVMARLFPLKKKYKASKAKQFWLSLGWFSDVIILDAGHLRYPKVYEELQFDVCFCGSEYGVIYEEDKSFMVKNNVCFVHYISESCVQQCDINVLKICIENLHRNQKVVLYGTEEPFDIFMNNFPRMGKKYIPAYAIDDNPANWNTLRNGIRLKEPVELLKEKVEDVLVIICQKNYISAVEQLQKIGKFDYRIAYFKNEIALLEEFAIAVAEENAYLKKSHNILLTLMKEFDRVCQENNLHYYIICGTLIGVIRHRNLIPWDDDIDIAIPRKDYQKLRKIAKKEWNNDTFKYINYPNIGGGAFFDCMPRLFYMKEHLPTKCFDKVYGKANIEIADRMFLDIYVMDNAHENELAHKFMISAMKGIYNLMMGHRAYIDYDIYKNVVSGTTIRLMKCLHKIGQVIPIKLLAFCYDTFSRSANLNRKCKNYIMGTGLIRYIGKKFPKEYYGEGLRMPLADIEVTVPQNYDAQLIALGHPNYMKMPRMARRKPSHYFNSDIEVM